MAAAQQGYSGKRTAEIVGITYRQLDYWARTDLIRPSLTDASGSGSRRLYAYEDLLELRIVKQLLDAGIKLEMVRQVFARATQHHAAMLVAARAKVEHLMTEYGLALPPDYHAFADSLELTHVKPYPDGGAELIFGVCSWFPNFDLNAALDAELAIDKVWFDG